MKKINALLAISGLLIFITTGFAAQESAKKQAAPAPAKKVMTKFQRADKDKDGKISVQEYLAQNKKLKKVKAEAAFKAKDKNNDGFLSEEEFNAK